MKVRQPNPFGTRLEMITREVTGVSKNEVGSQGTITRPRRKDVVDSVLALASDVNSTPHTSHFLVNPHLMTRTCVAQVVSLACAVHISQSPHASSPCAHVVCLILRDFSTFISLLSIFTPINLIFHDVVDKFPVHFS